MRWILKDNGFHVAAAGLVLLLLVPIWANRFLPLQDYPQHLFNAHVGSTYDDPSLNWSENLRLENPIAPYRLASYGLRLMATVAGAEIAGKLFLSIYAFVILLLVYEVRRRVGTGGDPWCALLFFPLAFHPMYFLGFLNFTLSIPLLLLALLDLEAYVAQPLSRRSALRQGLWCLGLFMLHPFTASIYIVLAFARLTFLIRDPSALLRGLIPPLALALVYFLWLLEPGMTGEGGRLPQGSALPEMRWWPVQWRLNFFGLPFAGMRITEDPPLLPILVWAGIGLLVLIAAVLKRREWRPHWFFLLALALVVAGYAVLPFSVHTDRRYTFFSTRFAPVSYFVLVLAISTLPMHRYKGQALAALCAVLLILSADLQSKVSSEIESIVPITAKMKKNAAVLPMIPRSSSPHLDPFFFAQFHFNEIFYYHLIVGGGFNPHLFGNRLMLVRYKGERPPTARNSRPWPEYAALYDYVIGRGLDSRMKQRLRTTCSLLARSGEWELYEIRRTPGPPTRNR